MPRRPARDSLAVEALEGRRVLAAGVAVGAEAGHSSVPLVRLVDAATGAVKAQVLAFEAGFKGGVRVAMGDVDGDGTAEVLAASGPGRMGEIRAFKQQQAAGGATVLTELVAYRTVPFGRRYTGGVEVAAGDVDGNGLEDIVAAMSRGAGTVSVFRAVVAADPVENTAFRSLIPFGRTFNGGASVAVADLGYFNGGRLVDAGTPDGRVEILVGSGAGMRAAVLVYDLSAAPRIVARIAPVSARLQGGVSVSSGRVDADASDDIIVSAGRGGGGVTEVFAGRVAAAGGTQRLGRFAAFSGLARPNAPVFTAAVDIDGDGRIDRFLATQGDAGGSAGLAHVSTAGVRKAAFATVAGPLRIAAARSFVATASGLQYRDVVPGTGPLPVVGQTLAVHYIGRLADGTVFDSSLSRGQPFEFALGLGQVIQGWDEGVASMRVGGWRKLVIPPSLGYGSVANGNIPANSTLFFDVELIAIR